MSRMDRILAFSCLHAPTTHKGYFDWLLAQIEDFKPSHVVNLGDWYEGLASSRWPKRIEQKWTLFDEHNAVADQARRINEVAPTAMKHWIAGNHDDNAFGTNPGRIPDDLREVALWRNHRGVAEALEGWKILSEYSDRARLRLGPITFQHGTAHNSAVGKDKAYLYGTPFGLYVFGHTHRPEPVTQCRERQVRLPYWYANPGTGIDFDQAYYMQRCSMALWGRGCIKIETPGVEHRRSAFATKNWEAETVIHSWAHP